MNEKEMDSQVMLALDNATVLDKESNFYVDKVNAADAIKRLIHAAILADREERKLDVDSVRNEVFKLYPCSCYQQPDGEVDTCYNCRDIDRNAIANAIVSAISAPRRVSVEEMEKIQCTRCEYKSSCLNQCEASKNNAQAIHSLVYGDAVENAK